MTLIIGSEGRIGKRYKAVLKNIGESILCCDSQLNNVLEMDQMIEKSDRILLCTPTDTHFDLMMKLIPFKKPILCEKPMTKNYDELGQIFQLASAHGTKVNMVMQYKEIYRSDKPGQPSYYDYYNHGPDGKYWDTMQVIGLAKGPIKIMEESPIWKCMINGEEVSFVAMDYAYIKMMTKWIQGNLEQDPDEIIRIHRKVVDLIDAESNDYE